MELRVAGAQLPVTNDVATNLQAIVRAIDFAAAEHAEILLTPEGSLSGYTPHFDTEEVTNALEQVLEKAKSAKVGLALGTCFVEPKDGLCYNQIRFYSPKGVYLGFHSKTLTCGTMTEPSFGEINDYTVQPLQTYTFQKIPVGGLICNDLWANPSCTPKPDPHLTHQLAERGVRVLFHAVNGGRDGSSLSAVHWHFHESNLRLRTRASKLWTVTVDNCLPLDLPCSAPSGVLNPEGEWVVQAPPIGEQFFAHTLEISLETG